ncbi:MAG: glycoside hydrolase family 73 protein [Bacteroidales bacterium]
MKLTRNQYIEKVTPFVIKASSGSGLFPSLFMAQAILESADGNSTLASVYNNHFGIKADKNWKGKVVNMKTREVINGSDQIITDGFRVYDSPEQSFIDRVKFLKENARYKAVFAAATPLLQAIELKKAKYATDPNYDTVLQQIIKYNNLITLDQKKK